LEGANASAEEADEGGHLVMYLLMHIEVTGAHMLRMGQSVCFFFHILIFTALVSSWLLQIKI
jgi:hypothetical protein